MAISGGLIARGARQSRVTFHDGRECDRTWNGVDGRGDLRVTVSFQRRKNRFRLKITLIERVSQVLEPKIQEYAGVLLRNWRK